VATRWPRPRFEIATVRRFDPPLARTAAVTAGALFLAVLGGASAFLWNAHQLTTVEQVAAAAAVVAALWLIGAITQPRSADSADAEIATQASQPEPTRL
jgi:uncharacterized membrane protein